MVDRGFKQDGFKALVDLNRRYDTRTAAILLQSYLEVVNPPGIKGLEGMAAGIHKWEAKVSALMCRYKEELNSNFKISYFHWHDASGFSRCYFATGMWERHRA